MPRVHPYQRYITAVR
ncbi:hypothetical protein IT400_03195 [Candidatus Nomurabacteria bacterium]|nr:hypothetical protein [Candidatus Nomurabacteria bacterium]